MNVIKLRKVNIEDAELFREQSVLFAKEEFDFAYKYSPDKPFEEYLTFLKHCESDTDLSDESVLATFLLAENVNGRVVGRISIRHYLNDFLEQIGGHVGYAVIAKFRKKGYGTQILDQAIKYIKKNIDLNKILVTCDETNIGSQKIIESNGGKFESSYTGPKVKMAKRRYWISI